MKINNSISSKNHNRYKKLKYKSNKEVYNIVNNTNINFNNKNNQSDEMTIKKQLIKTLIDKKSTFKRSFN